MTTSCRVRLLRVPSLRALHRAIAAWLGAPGITTTRAAAVLVPTVAAAAQLRSTLEDLLLRHDAANGAAAAIVLPDLLTRDQLYHQLYLRLPGAARWLDPIEREAIMSRAAAEAIESGARPPFAIRPGLMAPVLDFYDALGRNRRTVDTFERLLVGELSPQASIDRGADRLLQQTRFLAATFRRYEQHVARAGGLDEHLLRERVLAAGTASPWRRVLVTAGDHVSDPGGLWDADFDLLARLSGLSEIAIVATAAVLDAGLRERLYNRLPDVEEVSTGDPDGQPFRSRFTSRDREDELSRVARIIRNVARTQPDPPPLGKTAVVFRRPLPYVYLARTVFGGCGIPIQMADTLPLAAEPYAAAFDLVISAVSAGYTRRALIALLACPHFVFTADDTPIGREEVAALDRALSEAGFLGGFDALEALVPQLDGRAAQAAAAALAMMTELAPLATTQPISAHLEALLRFLAVHDRRLLPDDPLWERHQRTRQAIMGAIQLLRDAHMRFHDPAVPLDTVASAIRRWIEAETFAPRTGTSGLHLIDAQAARYGDFDCVFLVGLVADDWPGGTARDIFYPPALLAALGWPPERARLAAVRAAFMDLADLARRHVTMSTFQLEDDALVEPSPFVEEVGDVVIDEGSHETGVRIFAAEALTLDPIRPEAAPAAAAWTTLRLRRPPPGDPAFRGHALGYAPAVLSVTAVDLYLTCPFKFFATHVLRLTEEAEDEEGLTPRERGVFVHRVLRDFYAAWQEAGGGAITPATLDAARRLFAEVAERAVATLPEADQLVERTRLLGAAGVRGAGDSVLEAEAASLRPAVERLLEHELSGHFDLMSVQGPQRLALRGQVDRVDLLGGYSFRVVDYKTGSGFDLKWSVQLPIYAVLVAQHLARARGGRWTPAEGLYVVLRGRDRVRPIVSPAQSVDTVLAEAQQRFVDAVEAMARGEFPVRPADAHLCASCRFSTVCRKDYAGDA